MEWDVECGGVVCALDGSNCIRPVISWEPMGNPAQ